MDTHMDFDLELAKKKTNENPIFYIQYANARISQILKKIPIPKETQLLKKEKLDEIERECILQCLDLPEVVLNATNEYSPHKLANYVYKLAKTFHSFYEKCPIIKEEKEVKEKRIKLILKIKKTLNLSLELLGISAPDQM